MTANEKVYQMITDRVMDLLKTGTVPWHKPWTSPAGGFFNLKSKKPYRGINVFSLAAGGFSSPYFVSFKQAKEMGGSVKKGEKGTPVIFWRWLEIDDDKVAGTKKRIPFLRYYTVFNAADQCEGLESKIPEVKKNPLNEAGLRCEAADMIVESMPNRPEVQHGGHKACYRIPTDTVHMPPKESFDGCEEYYSVLFHELVHSTGHHSRVGRPGIENYDEFGSHQYSKEELVAEMGAAFLCGLCGIESKTLDNSAAYIASWMKRLTEDPKLVVQAAAQAQRAVDFITNKTYNEPENTNGEQEHTA